VLALVRQYTIAWGRRDEGVPSIESVFAASGLDPRGRLGGAEQRSIAATTHLTIAVRCLPLVYAQQGDAKWEGVHRLISQVDRVRSENLDKTGGLLLAPSVLCLYQDIIDEIDPASRLHLSEAQVADLVSSSHPVFSRYLDVHAIHAPGTGCCRDFCLRPLGAYWGKRWPPCAAHREHLERASIALADPEAPKDRQLISAFSEASRTVLVD
jgi:hypothetical protein